MKRVLLGAVSSIVLLSTPAFAQTFDQDSGWYVRGNAGYGTHTGAEFDNGLFNGADVESEGNVAGSVGVGYEFGEGSDLNNWRIELDGDTLWTDLGAIGQEANSFANVRTNSLMANAIYSFDDAFENNDSLNFLSKVTPYVGAGLGIINADLRAVSHAGVNDTNTAVVNNPVCLGLALGECEVDDDDTALGWQVLGGFEMEILNNLFWDTHYTCLLYTSPSPRDATLSRMPSSA